MKTMKDVACGSTITVRKVTGGRAVEKRLEELGIMGGTDLTLLEVLPEGALRVKRGCCRELVIDAADAERIVVGDQFKRNGDPVLVSGCCGGGDISALLERVEASAKENDKL